MNLGEHPEQWHPTLTALHSLSGPLAVDTETTGLNLYAGDVMRGISLAWRQPDGEVRTVYLPFTHPKSRNLSQHSMTTVIKVLKERSEQGRLDLYHNACFDWQVLKLADTGFVVPSTFWDTQTVAWLEDENLRKGLKDQGALWFGEDAKAEQHALDALRKGRRQDDIYRELRQTEEWGKRGMAGAARERARQLAYESKRDWPTFTAEDIAAYAEQDVALTLRLYERQVELEPDPDFRPAIQREFQVQGVAYRMMRKGILVNQDAVRRQREETEQELAVIESRWPEVNLASNQQVAHFLFSELELPCVHTTRAGHPSVSRDALNELEGHHAVVDDLLTYRRLSKKLVAYYRPLERFVAEDGRIHPSFNTTGTTTGRWSCSMPNLQTIPRSDTLTGVRECFVPTPGLELWEYDLSSAEQRVMMGWAGEEQVIEGLLEGRDLHAETAQAIFGDDWTGLQRRLAKNINYGFAYGLGAVKLAGYMVKGSGKRADVCEGWTLDKMFRCGSCHACEAAGVLEGYRRAYPRLVRLMDGLSRRARADGYLPLHVPGRFRRFRSPGRAVPYYTALNALVQGGIGEFMKDVMLEAESAIGAHGELVLQVHDSLVIEVDPGAGPTVHKILQGLCDQINPFKMPMRFDAQEWSKHE